MKKILAVVAALVAAPVVGWIIGGALVLLGLNVAMRRFEQADLDADLDEIEADIAALSGVSPLSRGEAPNVMIEFNPQELWRELVRDYREYDEGSPYGNVKKPRWDGYL